MSEPTYRIRIERDEEQPKDSHGAWDAHIFRVSDDELMRTEWGATPESAEAYALKWIQTRTAVPITLYDRGRGAMRPARPRRTAITPSMSDGRYYLITFCVIMSATTLLLNTLLGQPPIHCRYLVTVKSTPGVYACSQHPTVKVKP